MTTSELRHRLQTLSAERAAAALTGLAGNRSYLDDLEEETQATREAYIGAAVIEIASFRAQLVGPQAG